MFRKAARSSQSSQEPSFTETMAQLNQEMAQREMMELFGISTGDSREEDEPAPAPIPLTPEQHWAVRFGYSVGAPVIFPRTVTVYPRRK